MARYYCDECKYSHTIKSVIPCDLHHAAAPMLATLKAVLPRLEDWADGCEADEPDALAVKMVREAIEKAEGR